MPMDLKENIVKSMLMTVKIMTVKIILHVSMGLTTTHAFARPSTQVGRMGNGRLSVCASEHVRGTLLHVFSKLLYWVIAGRCLRN